MVREKLLGAMTNNGSKQKVIQIRRGGAVHPAGLGVCCFSSRREGDSQATGLSRLGGGTRELRPGHFRWMGLNS